MSTDLAAAAAAAVLCGLACLGVPRLIAWVPEPDQSPEPVEGEPPKEPYVEIAARPGLAWRSALAGAVTGALLGGSVGWAWGLLLVLPLVPVGIALSVIDWRTRLLPTRIVLPATGAALVLGVVATWAAGDLMLWVRGLAGLVVARTIFWVLWAVRSAGMGFGDVRLSALLGFVLAVFGWGAFAIGFYSAFLLFGVPGLVLAIVRRDRSILKRGYPFGPFLLVGAVVGVVWGQALASRLVGG
jgi:leader peptidase (prepilin peptidase)/N-methyltransferase